MTSSVEMQAFVRIVELGSFAAAAPELGLTASAMSKLVTRVEDRLGVRLLTRTTRRLALTAEGATYLTRAREILAAIEAAEAEVSACVERPRGVIRLNAGTALGKHQLAPVLPEFHRRFPEIRIDLSISDRQIDILAENVDMVLRTGPLADSSMVARKIADGRRLITASPDYLDRHGTPRVPADLSRHNCMVIPGVTHLARWPFHTPEGINRMEVRGNVTCDNADLLLDLAIAGHGIVRLGDALCGQAVKRGQLVPLLVDHHVDEPFPIWVLVSPGRQRLPRMRVFIDFLVETFASAPWRVD